MSPTLAHNLPTCAMLPLVELSQELRTFLFAVPGFPVQELVLR